MKKSRESEDCCHVHKARHRILPRASSLFHVFISPRPITTLSSTFAEIPQEVFSFQVIWPIVLRISNSCYLYFLSNPRWFKNCRAYHLVIFFIFSLRLPPLPHYFSSISWTYVLCFSKNTWWWSTAAETCRVKVRINKILSCISDCIYIVCELCSSTRRSEQASHSSK
jgi:hypothetical protein